ncbi:MAG: transcriptional regulator, partial [Anaerolineae bacterium]|nr:transcriptional regulator [Anaerolineae bacterium]
SSNVARKFSAKCINLHVPAILSTAEIAATLRAESLIAKQLDAISDCNKTLFAVGSCKPDSHVASSGVATQKELEDYIANGAVGVLCGRFIDAKGDPVSGPLDDRMMGIELEELRHRDMGILVSVGEERVPAAVAAIRGGYATHVVTNQSCASAMMELA